MGCYFEPTGKGCSRDAPFNGSLGVACWKIKNLPVAVGDDPRKEAMLKRIQAVFLSSPYGAAPKNANVSGPDGASTPPRACTCAAAIYFNPNDCATHCSHS